MKVPVEGLSPEELLAISDEDLEILVLSGEPVVFRAGTAEILGQFQVQANHLVVELAHIEGGGEGVLPLSRIEWFVYTAHCARPSPKLRRVLERRGFELRNVESKGACYHRAEPVCPGPVGYAQPPFDHDTRGAPPELARPSRVPPQPAPRQPSTLRTQLPTREPHRNRGRPGLHSAADREVLRHAPPLLCGRRGPPFAGGLHSGVSHRLGPGADRLLDGRRGRGGSP